MLTDNLSVDRDHGQPDPPLTATGFRQAHEVQPPAEADLVVVSPMTRTIQTALIVFDQLLNRGSASLKLEVWPDLREAHDAICNTGVGRATLAAQFDRLDFSDCPVEWNYPAYSPKDASDRAERVRHRLESLSQLYRNIYVVTHRGFIAFLVKGSKFHVCGKLLRICL